MIGVVKRLSIFFAHPKHQKKLEEAIQNTQSESNMLKLKDLCRTRLIKRIDALNRIKKLYPPLLLVLITFQLKVLSGLLTL